MHPPTSGSVGFMCVCVCFGPTALVQHKVTDDDTLALPTRSMVALALSAVHDDLEVEVLGRRHRSSQMPACGQHRPPPEEREGLLQGFRQAIGDASPSEGAQREQWRQWHLLAHREAQGLFGMGDAPVAGPLLTRRVSLWGLIVIVKREEGCPQRMWAGWRRRAQEVLAMFRNGSELSQRRRDFLLERLAHADLREEEGNHDCISAFKTLVGAGISVARLLCHSGGARSTCSIRGGSRCWFQQRRCRADNWKQAVAAALTGLPVRRTACSRHCVSRRADGLKDQMGATLRYLAPRFWRRLTLGARSGVWMGPRTAVAGMRQGPCVRCLPRSEQPSCDQRPGCSSSARPGLNDGAHGRSESCFTQPLRRSGICWGAA